MLRPNALTTVERLQVQLPDLADDLAEVWINVASQMIERHLSRPLGFAIIPTNAPERHPGNGTLDLHLNRWPIRSVQEVLLSGQAVTDYEIVDESRLYRESGWPRTVQRTGVLVRDPDARLVELSIKVAYTSGYILPPWDLVTNATYNPSGLESDLPADFEQACIWTVQDFEDRPSLNLKAERTPGGWSQEWAVFAKREALPARVVALLEDEKAFWF